MSETGETLAGDADQTINNNTGDVDAGDAGQPGGEAPQKDPEKEGLIKARDAEAKKARELREENERLKRVADELTRRKEPENLEDDDAIITVGEFKRRQRAVEEKRQLESQQELIKRTAFEANEKFKNAEVKWQEAYDFVVSAVNEGRISQAAVLAALQSKDNPAQELYDLAILKNPEFREKTFKTAQVKAVGETIETLNRHTNQAKTLSDVKTGNRVLDQVKQIEQMSAEDFRKLTDKVIAGEKVTI